MSRRQPKPRHNAYSTHSQLATARKGLSANRVGTNGSGHGLDNQLASVQQGDIVIPPWALTPAVVDKLKQALGDQWQQCIIGQGRELDLEQISAAMDQPKSRAIKL